MSTACRDCKPEPGRKCMRHRKSHDGLKSANSVLNEYPVKWVSYSVNNQAHTVAVNGKWISRSTVSNPHKTIVQLFTNERQNSLEILNDPEKRTTWKEFTSGCDPKKMNAIRANNGIQNWSGSEIYVGKFNKNNIGTIYRDIMNNCWKFSDEQGIDIDVAKNSCEVLCDKQNA